MQPEIATEPPSTFSAGFLSNKYPFSEQNPGFIKCPTAEGTPPADRPPPPLTRSGLNSTTRDWVLDARTEIKDYQPGAAARSRDTLEFTKTQVYIIHWNIFRRCFMI